MVGFGEGIVGLSEFPYIRSLFFFLPFFPLLVITAIADSVFGIWPKDEERAREESLGISGRQVEEEGWRDCFLFCPFRVRSLLQKVVSWHSYGHFFRILSMI